MTMSRFPYPLMYIEEGATVWCGSDVRGDSSGHDILHVCTKFWYRK